MRVGALLAALSVVLGALGAHALAERLDATNHLEHWKTAVQYQFAAVPGLFLLAFVHAPRWCGTALFFGCMLFSGSLYVIALGGPKWLGAVTPLGGLLLVMGYFMLAFSKKLVADER